MKFSLKTLIKIILLVVSFFFYSETAETEFPPKAMLEALKILHDTCVEKTGATNEAILEFASSPPGINVREEDESLKCYMHCLFTEIRVVDPNGDINLVKLFKLIPKQYKDIALKVGDKCHTPEGNNPCQKAFWFHKCWKAADPEHFILV